jgi:hypothetical protein
MASVTLSCPSAAANVQVTVQGAGSGAQGTICVKGSCAESLLLRVLKAIIRLLVDIFRWLFRLKPLPLTQLTGLTVRVRVVNGTVTTSPSPDPKLAGDVDVPASPNWCARDVPVPSWSSGGSPLTVFVWLLSGVGSGGSTVVDGPQSRFFNGGGPNPTDCCSGCASTVASEKAYLAGELASHPGLEVAVPDGPNAGLHRATVVSYLTWAVTVRGVTFEVSCDRGAVLVLRGPSSASPSKSVEGGPFSATFPGAVLGAVGDVVVTKA